MTQPKTAALTDVVCVSASQVASRVGDELAILDLDHSVYFGLDPVGTRIWELIQEPAVLSSVLEAVLAEYDVDEDTARKDLLALVDDLLAQGLVEVRATDAA